MGTDHRLLAAFAAILCIAVSSGAQAQTPQRAASQPPQERCLRALNGACTNPAMVEAARLRALIISSVRVSYFGTPAGTVGGNFIPFERFFQDNDILFGLPSDTCEVCGVVRRSK